MQLHSLWILSLGFVVFAASAHATQRGAESRDTQPGRRDHPTHSRMAERMAERETLTIRLESNARDARSHSHRAMQVRNDDLARTISEADQTRHSTVPRRPAQQSFSVVPRRWQEQIQSSNIPSGRIEQDISSSPTPQINPESEAPATAVPEPSAAMLFGGGLVLVYTLAASRRVPELGIVLDGLG